jgi:predicted MFS family arabinose efflux permease
VSGTADEDLQWDITLFAFSSVSQVLLMRRFGDYCGRKKMKLMGMAIRNSSFEEGMLRNTALGLNGELPSLGFAVGAVLGGALTDVFGWHFSSLMSFPFGLVFLGLARFMIKDVAKRINQKLDVPGAVTLMIDLLALVLGAAAIGRGGWGSTTILGGLITFPLESGKFFLLTIELQLVLESTALATGLAFGVLGAGVFAGGILAARIIDKISARTTLVRGLALQGRPTISLLPLGMNAGMGFVHILIV